MEQGRTRTMLSKPASAFGFRFLTDSRLVDCLAGGCRQIQLNFRPEGRSFGVDALLD